jgi:hypothetical protein
VEALRTSGGAAVESKPTPVAMELKAVERDLVVFFFFFFFFFFSESKR